MGRSRKKGEKAIFWKVGKYIRLSRDDGNSESESITNQRKILDEQIPGFFNGDYRIVDEYTDDGRSGTSGDVRPEFQRLTEDVKSGRINCIITKNLSRAFRNSADQGKFLEEFIPLYGARFISLYEPKIDTFLNPEAVHSLEVGITGFLNQQYAYKTSVDVRRTFDTKRRKGEFIGAFSPYGLKKDPDDKNHLLVDEEAAEVVREIFRWFADEGMSKGEIAKRLNGLGIPNPAAYKRQKGMKYYNPQVSGDNSLWSGKTVGAILSNEMYIGNMVQGRQKVISYKVHRRVAVDEKDWYFVENTHEAVIDKETFEKARTLQQRNVRVPPGRKTPHLFSGFLRCADCKKTMTRKTARNIVYYNCSTYSRQSKTACTKHTIREDVLEKAALITIRKQIAAAADMEKIAGKTEAYPSAFPWQERIRNLIETRKKELKKLVCASDQLYIDWSAGEVTEEEYQRMKAGFKARSTQLQEAIDSLREEIAAPGTGADEQYPAVFSKEKGRERLDRELLAALVDVIYIHQDGAVTICFSFTDPYRP